ncbi:hypothetical protein ACFLZI_00895, partial [Nitrospirota bacterium]
ALIIWLDKNEAVSFNELRRYIDELHDLRKEELADLQKQLDTIRKIMPTLPTQEEYERRGEQQ